MQAYRYDLRQHMAQCDANYYRLNQLFPAMAKEDQRELLVQQGSMGWQLRLAVTERQPYTTMLDFSQQLMGQEWLPELRMELRVYHDVRMVEVLSCQQQRPKRARNEYPNPAMLQPDEKAQQNSLLTECLSRALDFGFEDSPAWSVSTDLAQKM